MELSWWQKCNKCGAKLEDDWLYSLCSLCLKEWDEFCKKHHWTAANADKLAAEFRIAKG